MLSNCNIVSFDYLFMFSCNKSASFVQSGVRSAPFKFRSISCNMNNGGNSWMKCWAASDENIFFLLLNSATEFSCSTRGKLQPLHFWVFNNHTKSLYLLCSFGSRPENFLFCCRHFCQTADVDKTELQKKRGGALIFPPLAFTVLLSIKNSAVYLYLSWNTQTHMPPCIVSWKYADLYAKIVQDVTEKSFSRRHLINQGLIWLA